MGKGSVVPSPEGDARRWFVVVMELMSCSLKSWRCQVVEYNTDVQQTE